MNTWNVISSTIARATASNFRMVQTTAIAGGCINQAFRVEGSDGSRYFVKLNDARHLPMLHAEAAGLSALKDSDTLRVPQVIACDVAGSQAYLVLEQLDLRSKGNARLLGEQLAALHRCSSDQFGFAQDNFIGTTPQPNACTSDWIAFWREQRLGFQLELAARNGYRGNLQQLGRQLMDCLPQFFDDYQPQASLLHGDLWSGNHACLNDGSPVIFDPAPYYGDRECDLAMTELFGGFSQDFYAAYQASWPLHPGYAKRKTLYNLYHILNHANLFGGGYAQQAERMMQTCIAHAPG